MQVADNRTNKAAYEAQLPNLRQRYPLGHFAVFAGAALVGAYPSYGEALRHGYERAGKADFFVKQITQKEEVQHVATPFAVA
ncbi:MAG: hypothetical protein ACKVY0_02250 [Prosthecobacter sp.]|uniref:hypothetical protein n=1 Tax=Prosthecobacter sp. TaxID=1965333 RepID=UPI0039029BB2